MFRMRTSLVLGTFTGMILAAVGAAVEAAWLMFFHTLSFGVRNESVLLLQSFGVYLVAGTIAGGWIGGLVHIILRVLRRPFTGADIVIDSGTGFLGICLAAGSSVYVFSRVLPQSVETGSAYGSLTLLAIGTLTIVLSVALRWGFRWALRPHLERVLQRPAFMAWTAILCGLPLVVLGGVQHVRTADKKATPTLVPPATASRPATLPNVILITLDTVRARNLNLYGYERETAPNLTRFARTSVLYERAYAHSSWTLPSHSTLFTGRYPSEISASWGSRGLERGHITLAEILRARGYRTAGFVGGPFCSRHYGLAQGFDFYEDRLPTRSTPLFSQLLNRIVANLFSQPGKRRADRINEFVFPWLEHNASAPFFLFINYFDAHATANPIYPFRNAFDGGFHPLRSFFLQQGAIEIGVRNGARSFTEAERRHWMAMYDGEILFLDHQLQLLFQKLQDLDAFENSLIVVTSDHGHSYGEHGLAGHGGWLFEEVVRVPLLIRYPGGEHGGTTVADRFGLVHLFSLITREVGGSTTGSRSGGRGRGTAIVLEIGRGWPHPDRKFRYSDRDLRALYSGRYKLVTVDGEMAELYDLEGDPEELVNLLAGERALGRDLDDSLAGILQAMRPPPPTVDDTEDPEKERKELLEQLKALGYL